MMYRAPTTAWNWKWKRHDPDEVGTGVPAAARNVRNCARIYQGNEKAARLGRRALRRHGTAGGKGTMYRAPTTELEVSSRRTGMAEIKSGPEEWGRFSALGKVQLV